MISISSSSSRRTTRWSAPDFRPRGQTCRYSFGGPKALHKARPKTRFESFLSPCSASTSEEQRPAKRATARPLAHTRPFIEHPSSVAPASRSPNMQRPESPRPQAFVPSKQSLSDCGAAGLFTRLHSSVDPANPQFREPHRLGGSPSPSPERRRSPSRGHSARTISKKPCGEHPKAGTLIPP